MYFIPAVILMIIGCVAIFFFPIGTIMSLFIFGFSYKLLDMDDDRDADKRQKIKRNDESFNTLRKNAPLEEKFFKNTRKFYKRDSDYNSHRDWLNGQIDIVESYYSQSESYFRDGILGGWDRGPEGNNRGFAKEVVSSPRLYKEICKKLNRKPIPELMEDWNKHIKEQQRKLDAKNAEENEKIRTLDEIEKTIINGEKNNIERSDIISDIKNRDRYNKYVIHVKRINNIWYITLGDENTVNQYSREFNV